MAVAYSRRYGEQIPPLPRGQFFGKMLPKFVFERRKQLQKCVQPACGSIRRRPTALGRTPQRAVPQH